MLISINRIKISKKFLNYKKNWPYSLKNIFKFKKPQKTRVFNRLAGAPFRKGIVLRLKIITPKKPNSAIRHVAKTSLYKHHKQIFARIPGIGNMPAKFNRILVRGGRANDLPTVRLTAIRGVYDFSGLYSKIKRRSIYGAPRLESMITHRRRKFRHLNL